MVKGLWTAILLMAGWVIIQWVVRGRCLIDRLLLIVRVVSGPGVSIMARRPNRRARRIHPNHLVLVMRADCSKPSSKPNGLSCCACCQSPLCA